MCPAQPGDRRRRERADRATRRRPALTSDGDTVESPTRRWSGRGPGSAAGSTTTSKAARLRPPRRRRRDVGPDGPSRQRAVPRRPPRPGARWRAQTGADLTPPNAVPRHRPTARRPRCRVCPGSRPRATGGLRLRRLLAGVVILAVVAGRVGSRSSSRTGPSDEAHVVEARACRCRRPRRVTAGPGPPLGGRGGAPCGTARRRVATCSPPSGGAAGQSRPSTAAVHGSAPSGRLTAGPGGGGRDHAIRSRCTTCRRRGPVATLAGRRHELSGADVQPDGPRLAVSTAASPLLLVRRAV